MRVSPEEISAAFLLAIARDIIRKETKDVLNRSYKLVRSTTCTFVLPQSEMDRYWYSLDRRENCEHEFTAVHRSCFQRIYEVNRFAQKLRDTETSAIAGAVFKEYSETLKHMNMQAAGCVTEAFCDVAVTIGNLMWNVPQIALLLRKMDDQPKTMFNLFDSHTRLQSILNKCSSRSSRAPPRGPDVRHAGVFLPGGPWRVDRSVRG